MALLLYASGIGWDPCSWQEPATRRGMCLGAYIESAAAFYVVTSWIQYVVLGQSTLVKGRRYRKEKKNIMSKH